MKVFTFLFLKIWAFILSPYISLYLGFFFISFYLFFSLYSSVFLVPKLRLRSFLSYFGFFTLLFVILFIYFYKQDFLFYAFCFSSGFIFVYHDLSKEVTSYEGVVKRYLAFFVMSVMQNAPFIVLWFAFLFQIIGFQHILLPFLMPGTLGEAQWAVVKSPLNLLARSELPVDSTGSRLNSVEAMHNHVQSVVLKQAVPLIQKVTAEVSEKYNLPSAEGVKEVNQIIKKVYLYGFKNKEQIFKDTFLNKTLYLSEQLAKLQQKEGIGNIKLENLPLATEVFHSKVKTVQFEGLKPTSFCLAKKITQAFLHEPLLNHSIFDRQGFVKMIETDNVNTASLLFKDQNCPFFNGQERSARPSDIPFQEYFLKVYLEGQGIVVSRSSGDDTNDFVLLDGTKIEVKETSPYVSNKFVKQIANGEKVQGLEKIWKGVNKGKVGGQTAKYPDTKFCFHISYLLKAYPQLTFEEVNAVFQHLDIQKYGKPSFYCAIEKNKVVISDNFPTIKHK